MLNDASPYEIDVVDGQTAICENGVPVAEAVYPEKPVYYGSKFDDGTRYEQVIPLLYDSYAFITTFAPATIGATKRSASFATSTTTFVKSDG